MNYNHYRSSNLSMIEVQGSDDCLTRWKDVEKLLDVCQWTDWNTGPCQKVKVNEEYHLVCGQLVSIGHYTIVSMFRR